MVLFLLRQAVGRKAFKLISFIAFCNNDEETPSHFFSLKVQVC